jgi:hypothetical protein
VRAAADTMPPADSTAAWQALWGCCDRLILALPLAYTMSAWCRVERRRKTFGDEREIQINATTEIETV